MPLTLTRSLLVVLIPGGVALSPWVFWLIAGFGEVATFYSKYQQLAWIVVFAAAAVLGTIIEVVNSYIEVHWDKQREREWDVKKNWLDYLARASSPEPVANEYLSKLATTMYFELAMMWAAFIFVMGLVPVFETTLAKELDLPKSYMVAGLLGGTATAWLRKSAKDTHLVLCSTRKGVNERFREQEQALRAVRRFVRTQRAP